VPHRLRQPVRAREGPGQEKRTGANNHKKVLTDGVRERLTGGKELR